MSKASNQNSNSSSFNSEMEDSVSQVTEKIPAEAISEDNKSLELNDKVVKDLQRLLSEERNLSDKKISALEAKISKMKLAEKDYDNLSLYYYIDTVFKECDAEMFKTPNQFDSNKSSKPRTAKVNLAKFLFQPGFMKYGSVEDPKTFSDIPKTDLDKLQNELGKVFPSRLEIRGMVNQDCFVSVIHKQQVAQRIYYSRELPALTIVNKALNASSSDYLYVYHTSIVPEQVEKKALKDLKAAFPDSKSFLNKAYQLQPDGIFCLDDIPLMICQYKVAYNLEKKDFEAFKRFAGRLNDMGKSPIEVFFSQDRTAYDIDLDAWESSNQIMEAMLENYNSMVKYGVYHSSVIYGAYWIFLYIYPEDPSTFYYCFETDRYFYVEPRTFRESTFLFRIIDSISITSVKKVSELLEDHPFETLTCSLLNAWNMYNQTDKSCDTLAWFKHVNRCHIKEIERGEDVQIIDSDEESYISDYVHLEPLPKYCTQKCLLGLKANSPMDENCPNYLAHKKNNKNGNLHPVSCSDLITLLYNQVKEGRGGYYRRDIISGGCSHIYKVTVYSYGYTITGTSRSNSYAGDLLSERAGYKALEELQGEWIPIFLGIVKFYDDDIDITAVGSDLGTRAMCLLSYGGEVMGTGEVDPKRVEDINQVLEEYGVQHTEICKENLLWSDELNHEMLINLKCLHSV